MRQSGQCHVNIEISSPKKQGLGCVWLSIITLNKTFLQLMIYDIDLLLKVTGSFYELCNYGDMLKQISFLGADRWIVNSSEKSVSKVMHCRKRHGQLKTFIKHHFRSDYFLATFQNASFGAYVHVYCTTLHYCQKIL